MRKSFLTLLAFFVGSLLHAQSYPINGGGPGVEGAATKPASVCVGNQPCVLDGVFTTSGTAVAQSTTATATQAIIRAKNFAGTELMRVQQNGNVGIGTTGPATLLDVAGAAQFGSGASKSTITAQGNIVGASGFTLGGSSVSVSNSFAVGGSTLVADNSRIGIGIAVPAVTLDVVGQAQFGGGATKSTFSVSGDLTFTSARYIEFANGSNANSRRWKLSNDANASGDLWLRVGATQTGDPDSGTSVLELTSGGSVGIGTTNPGRLFTVDGGAANNYVSSMSVNGQTLQHYADSSGNWFFDGGGTLGAGGPLIYFDNVGAAAGNKGIGLGYAGGTSFILDGNGAITDMPRISSDTLVMDGNVSPAIRISNGGLQVWSRTQVQIDTLVPEAVGQIIFCSNCSTANVCVSTGTAAAQWLRVDSTTAGCGSNN